MRKTLLVLLTATSLVTQSGAVSAAVAKEDPNDVAGKLDVKVIEMVEVFDPKTQDVIANKLKIETFGKWRCRYLASAKDTSLKWFLDTEGNSAAEWIGRFVCQNGALVMLFSSTDGSQNLEPLPVKRPNKMKANVTIPGDFFADVDRAWAKSKDGEAQACSDPCKDRAPDSGSLL